MRNSGNPREIIKAIDNCIAFVIVLSENSNSSVPVISEVERAFSKEKPVFPFRIKEIEPSEDLDFFIRVLHWCDGFEPPFENKIVQMAEIFFKGSISACKLFWPDHVSVRVIKMEMA